MPLSSKLYLVPRFYYMQWMMLLFFSQWTYFSITCSNIPIYFMQCPKITHSASYFSIRHSLGNSQVWHFLGVCHASIQKMLVLAPNSCTCCKQVHEFVASTDICHAWAHWGRTVHPDMPSSVQLSQKHPSSCKFLKLGGQSLMEIQRHYSPLALLLFWLTTGSGGIL